jgi:DNA adenine methylase
MLSKTCIICSAPLEGSRRKLCSSGDCQNRYNAQRQTSYRQRKGRTKRNAQALQIAPSEAKISGPPVRYFGGKWKIASWIIEQFPRHTTYVEPFCGAANVLFRKPPSRFEVINDLNHNIVTFFDVLRSRPVDLIKAIELTPYSREEHRRAHDEVPLQHPDRHLEIARRFYVRSRQSFGAGEGQYSTGWRFQRNDTRGGSSVTDEWNNLENLRAAVARLKSVQIESDTAINCIKRFDTPETLFYVDPPYLFETRHSNEHRYAHEMSNDEHVALGQVLKQVQGMVIISGYSSALYDELFAGWRCIQKTTTTNGNNEAIECLWISPRIDEINRLPLFDYLTSEPLSTGTPVSYAKTDAKCPAGEITSQK